MKLKNIFLTASFLLAAMSCSMEDELMNDVTRAQDESAAGFAYVAFSINDQAPATKAGSNSDWGTDNNETFPSDAVSKCSILVLDANQTVVAAHDGLSVTGNAITLPNNAKGIQVKLNKGETSKKFYVVIVANNTTTYAGCADYAAIQAKTIGLNDLNGNIKVSDLTEVIVPKGYPTISEASDHVKSVSVTVKQLTAKVVLTSFNTTFKESLPVDILIKDVKLLNRNISSITTVNSMLNQNLVNSDPQATTALTVWNGTTNTSPYTSRAIQFSTFANCTPASINDQTKFSFSLVYNHADEGIVTTPFSFTINRKSADDDFDNKLGTNPEHLYIESGYEYQIKINATLTSNKISCSAVLCVKDWNEQTFEYVMREITR